jgi:L-aspartate semialdehyde sulfurtransferase
VLTAEEVSKMAKTANPAEIAEKVDVVTTATFGAMCSSGAIINFGHASPPIRMEKIRLNGVPCYEGLAAVDSATLAPLPAIRKILNMVAHMLFRIYWKEKM